MRIHHVPQISRVPSQVHQQMLHMNQGVNGEPQVSPYFQQYIFLKKIFRQSYYSAHHTDEDTEAH